jgi:hypothetical protein
MIFSYFILCDFNYFYDDEFYDELIASMNNHNSTSNTTVIIYPANATDYFALKRMYIKGPSVLEYVMDFWVGVLILEEFRQV